ncbi:formyltetrahydrofolate deformylase [Microbacterium panaciterrae]|uniref:Formyltetrahydrofolate deformylase n=1 Tax=Microbacterium panaciterrae TaxID=985759 RepID=A0ABP8PDQ9_9MICO
MNAQPTHQLVLTLDCEDQLGIVHAVAGFLVSHGCNIVDSQQFDENGANRFFLRVQATYPAATTIDALRAAFQATADAFAMCWSLAEAAERVRTLLMVSKAPHCMSDLLERWSNGQLPVEIPAIVSNHRDLEYIADRFAIPFVHIPVAPDTKAAAEQELLALIDDQKIELVVLARYMQVLSDDLCSALPNRIINIHHSFLPGFKGSRPYHQAHARGVKLVGASAHYVTADLDEGPIIEQEVLRVDHRATPEDLVVAGREAERAALARAVRWHAEHRVMINGRRTVVFN